MFGAIATTGIWSWLGFTINMCEWDWMHAADLGATPVTLGNVYEELFLFLGGTRKHPLEACGKLLDMIKIASKELDMKQPPIYHLEYTQIRASPDSAPKLKVKAAEARHMVPVTHFILKRFFPLASDHEFLRFRCIDALHKCYIELHKWGPNSSATLGHEGKYFCMLYNQLNLDALRRSPRGLLWRMYPKFHIFIHLCESGYDPKTTWNYSDESAIGQGALVAESCHPATLSVEFIEKHRVLEFGTPIS